MSLKFAFAGFRHGHVYALLDRIRSTADMEIVGACEPDDVSRAVAQEHGVACEYPTLEALLSKSGCDVVVVGEAYGRRESVVLQALRAGKHVLSDKPFCTTLAGLEAIKVECAKPNAPRLGCMFDLGTTPAMTTARAVVAEGRLGELQSIQFNGMHPLNYRNGRPDWYFQPGMHGGTINDLASHAFDYLPRLVISPIDEILFANAKNVAFPECPDFQNVAQVAFRMKNGVVVSGDVSYTAPKTSAFSLPSYWRFTVTGTLGWMEFAYGKDIVLLANASDPEPQEVPLAPPIPDYFDGFLDDINGKTTEFTTQRHLQTAYWCLKAQQKA